MAGEKINADQHSLSVRHGLIPAGYVKILS
jgi:hypothetical protein